jgi:hypothetical protein
LTGEIIEGSISSGNIIHLPLNDGLTKLKIKSVEYIDYQGKKSEIGLVIEFLSENTWENIKRLIASDCCLLKGHMHRF